VRSLFTPSRMVLAAVGLPHEELVSLANSCMSDLNPDANVEAPKAAYTGGELRLHDSHADPQKGPALAHFALAFETASWHDQDLVPMCVLQMMMGGGGSFSAGGPGKGMYSRLYENVLNQHEWVVSATSFSSIFSDSSLFGIYGTCAPENAPHLVSVLTDESLKMLDGCGEEDLERAKKQLKSAVMMQLESRSAIVDDMARQLLTYGSIQSARQIAEKIDNVTVQHIKRVAEKMLKTKPTVAAAGDCSNMPRYDEILGRISQSA